MNEKYNRITVTSEPYRENGKLVVNGKCDCGNERVFNLYKLKSNHTKSCGCLRIEKYKSGCNYKDGLSDHPLQWRWYNMKQRCYNPNSKQYKDYGGRGIVMCEEWKYNFTSFYNWAIANGYKYELEIDRINNDGNYEPSNCQFVTTTENIRKRRYCKLNAMRVSVMKHLFTRGFSRAYIAERYGIAVNSVSLATTGKTWQ